MKAVLLLFIAVSASAIDIQEFPGADWCSQVNNADAAFNGHPALLVVTSSMSGMTACSSPIALTSNHVLQFESGSFNLGTLNGRAGIVIGHGISNVSITGAGIGITTLIFTSFNVGGANVFPWGSAVGIGNSSMCSAPSDPSNNIRISGVTFADQQTGSGLGLAHNPSIIDGACVNDITIEHNEFSNAKGNAAVTILGKFGAQGGLNYHNQFNKYDGTAAGNWGEFAADNSGNFTNVWWTGNSVSGYKCSAFGMSGIFRAIVTDNIIDTTLVGTGTCAVIGIGADAAVGYVEVANNAVFINATSIGPCIQTAPAGSSTDAMIDIQNNHCIALGSTANTQTQGIYINGVHGGSVPMQIVRGNYVNATYPILFSGPLLGNIEVSDNTLEGAGSGQGIIDCTGPNAIVSGAAVRVYENKINAGTQINNGCTDPSFVDPAFSHWDNTIGTSRE